MDLMQYMVAVHWFKGSDVLKSVNGYQHIIWWLLICFATAVSEWIGMLKNCRTGVTDELFVHIIDWRAHEQVHCVIYQEEGQLTGEWQTCWRLVLVLPLKSSTIKFTSTEFVEVGFPNNFWTHIIVIDCNCIFVMRVLCLSEFHCCFWWNNGCTAVI